MRNHPGRFQALAVVPPWGSKAMLREAERCIKELGFGGVQMAAHYGKLYLDDVVITQEALAKRATEQARVKPDTEVQLRADQAVSYGRVAELIGVLQTAGLNRVAFVTEGAAGASAASSR